MTEKATKNEFLLLTTQKTKSVLKFKTFDMQIEKFPQEHSEYRSSNCFLEKSNLFVFAQDDESTNPTLLLTKNLSNKEALEKKKGLGTCRRCNRGYSLQLLCIARKDRYSLASTFCQECYTRLYILRDFDPIWYLKNKFCHFWNAKDGSSDVIVGYDRADPKGIVNWTKVKQHPWDSSVERNAAKVNIEMFLDEMKDSKKEKPSRFVQINLTKVSQNRLVEIPRVTEEDKVQLVYLKDLQFRVVHSLSIEILRNSPPVVLTKVKNSVIVAASRFYYIHILAVKSHFKLVMIQANLEVSDMETKSGIFLSSQQNRVIVYGLTGKVHVLNFCFK